MMAMVIPAQAGIQVVRQKHDDGNLSPGSVTQISRGDNARGRS
jgi:hypothetical protein